MKKRKPYEKRAFESDGSNSDTSSNIYESMLLSPAWRSLTAQQKVLYVNCKAQYYAEKRKPKLTDDPHENNKTLFTMNRQKACEKYKLYKDNNRHGLYRDLKALCNKGFIRCEWNGKSTKSKSIYSFSSEWQHYSCVD